MKIEIQTKLHGVDHATGKYETQRVYKVGPRNLFFASQALREIRRYKVIHYGSIGAGHTRAVAVCRHGTHDVTRSLEDCGAEAVMRGRKTIPPEWVGLGG